MCCFLSESPIINTWAHKINKYHSVSSVNASFLGMGLTDPSSVNAGGKPYCLPRKSLEQETTESRILPQGVSNVS